MRSALFFGPWLLACGLGLWLLGSDASKSAPNASAPTTWPVSARVPKAPLQPSLVLFAHPYCACTRASLSELERILARAKDRPDVWVVLAKAKDGSTSSIANAARRIPGVHVIDRRLRLWARKEGTMSHENDSASATHHRRLTRPPDGRRRSARTYASW